MEAVSLTHSTNTVSGAMRSAATREGVRVCASKHESIPLRLYTGAGGSLVAMRTLARSCFVYKNACILRAKPAPAAALR